MIESGFSYRVFASTSDGVINHLTVESRRRRTPVHLDKIKAFFSK